MLSNINRAVGPLAMRLVGTRPRTHAGDDVVIPV
jgi:hypothetical protein